MSEKQHALIRVVINYDAQGRKIGYEVVETSKNPYFIANLECEIRKNLKVIESEKKEEAEAIQREQELQHTLTHYSLRKLLTLTGIAVTFGGLIDSGSKQTFLSEVRKIMTMPATLERAIIIETLLQQPECAAFKEVFEGMED